MPTRPGTHPPLSDARLLARRAARWL